MPKDKKEELTIDNGQLTMKNPPDCQSSIFHCQLQIPISEPIARYSSFRHIDLRMTPGQSQSLQRVRKALHDNHCKLRNNRHVDTFVDALRYVLERIEDGIEDFERRRVK